MTLKSLKLRARLAFAMAKAAAPVFILGFPLIALWAVGCGAQSLGTALENFAYRLSDRRGRYVSWFIVACQRSTELMLKAHSDHKKAVAE